MATLVKWKDIFNEEHVLIEGKNDDIFHVIPERRDSEGDSFTQILSKKAIIEIAEKLKSSGE